MSRSSCPRRDFVVLARHLVFGVFAQVAELARGFDCGLARGQLVLDDVLELFAARLQAPGGDEKPLFLRVGRFRRNERLDAREDFYYAREYRLLRKVFKALVEQKRLGEVARGVGGGAFEHVPYEVLVVAERVGERDSRGRHHGFALEGLVVDGGKKSAQKVFADERRKNVLVGGRVAVFDYPQNDGPAQSLLFKPPF